MYHFDQLIKSTCKRKTQYSGMEILVTWKEKEYDLKGRCALVGVMNLESPRAPRAC